MKKQNLNNLGPNSHQMKLILFFCLYSSLSYSQFFILDSVPLTINFLEANLNASQKTIIKQKFRTIGQTKEAKAEINLYAYSILDEYQREQFENAWKQRTINRINSDYSYLNLTLRQYEKLLNAMEHQNGSDTFKIIDTYSPVPVDSVMALLDTTQLTLEANYQNQKKMNIEKNKKDANEAKAKEVAFEKKRIELIKPYYEKNVLKTRKKIVSKIGNANPHDLKLIDSIAALYQARINIDRNSEIKKCYNQDSILISPIQKEIIQYKYERYSLMPNLCIYWCKFGTNKTPAIEAEEEKVVSGLEYIKATYPTLIFDSLQKLKKKKSKLQANIEKARPEQKPGTTVNIVADERVQLVEEIAELILVKNE